MQKPKKCPFNNFDDCIGSDCAFYIDSITQKHPFFDKGIEIDPNDEYFPCSISIVGKATFINNKPQPKELPE